MSVAWVVLLLLSVVLSIALIVFYEIYVYRRGRPWAQVVATLTFLVVLGLWLAFAVVYYKSTRNSTKLLCSSPCAPSKTYLVDSEADRLADELRVSTITRVGTDPLSL